MDYLYINNYKIPYPNDFTLQKVPNIVAEHTTMSGKSLADVNGWKYADTELRWDTLLEKDLLNLLDAISVSPFVIKCKDIDNDDLEVNAILRGRANTKTRLKYKGAIVWRDIAVSVSFPDCYREVSE